MRKAREKRPPLLRPLLRRIYPAAFETPDGGGDAIALNFTANLLGLGSAATPAGLRAAKAMAKRSGGTASDELCSLVVMNTASASYLPDARASALAIMSLSWAERGLNPKSSTALSMSAADTSG